MENTDATPQTAAPVTGDYLGSFMQANNLQTPDPGDLPVPPIQDTPATSGEPAAPSAADKPPVVDPPQDPKVPNPNQMAGAQRIAAKKKYEEEVSNLQNQLSEWERKYNEHKTELETQVTEHRKLAEERAAKLEELEKAYKNSAEQDWHKSVDELPEVKETAGKAQATFLKFFPKKLSDPSQDEADVRLNVQNLPPDKFEQVNRQILYWANAEHSPNATDEIRETSQHVAISNIAALLGVKPEAFEEKTYGGKVYQVLRPSHPVYRHLSEHIPDVVDTRAAYHQTRQAAEGNIRETFVSATRQRQENSKNILRTAGLTLSPEEIDSRLKQSPDNALLRSVRLLQSDPDLFNELKENIEHEAILNGHFSPQLALAETDPGERTKVAQAHMQRIGARFINAPLAGPLQKLALKQDEKIRKLEAELKYYKDEDDKAASQNEPGLAGGAPPAGNDKPMFEGKNSRYYEEAARIFGLNASA